MLVNQVNTRDIYTTNPGEFLKNTRFAYDWEDSAFQSTQAYSQGNSSQFENSQTSSYELFSQKPSQQTVVSSHRNESSSADQSKYHLKYLSMPPLFGKDGRSDQPLVTKTSTKGQGHFEQFEINKQRAKERDERDLIQKIFTGMKTCVGEVKAAAESIKETMNRDMAKGTEQSAQLIKKVNEDLASYFQTLLKTLQAKDEEKEKVAELEKIIAMKDTKIEFLQSQLEEAQQEQQKEVIETLKTAYNEQQQLNREQLEKFQREQDKSHALASKDTWSNGIASSLPKYKNFNRSEQTLNADYGYSFDSGHQGVNVSSLRSQENHRFSVPQGIHPMCHQDNNQVDLRYNDYIQPPYQPIYSKDTCNGRIVYGVDQHVRSALSTHKTNIDIQTNRVKSTEFVQNEFTTFENSNSHQQHMRIMQDISTEPLKNKPAQSLCQTLPVSLTSPTTESGTKWAGAARAKAKQSPVATVMPQVKQSVVSANCDDSKEDATELRSSVKKRRRVIGGSTQSNEHATRKSQRLSARNLTRPQVFQEEDIAKGSQQIPLQKEEPVLNNKISNRASAIKVYEYTDEGNTTDQVGNPRVKGNDERKTMGRSRSFSSIPSHRKVDRKNSYTGGLQMQDENKSAMDLEDEVPMTVKRHVKQGRRTPGSLQSKNQPQLASPLNKDKPQISPKDVCTRSILKMKENKNGISEGNILKTSTHYSDSEESSQETFTFVIPDSPVFMKSPIDEHRSNMSKNEDDFWSCSSSITTSGPMESEYKVSRSVEARRKLSDFSLKKSGINIPNIRRSMKTSKHH
ncbi:uncharacterized protein [Ptychodera flava]|uniref:uncharacterized protein isoform X2 n=1 Tax=Ptychodera flava TaxID=63121 RepID=UPI00396A94D3